MKKYIYSQIKKFTSWSSENRFFYIVSSFIILVLVLPLTSNSSGKKLITTIFTSLLIFVGMFSTRRVARKIRFEHIIGIAALVTTWFYYLYPASKWIYLLSALSTCLFFGCIILSSIKSLMITKKITFNLISAAVTIYMMIGFLGAMICKTLYTLNPNSFIINEMHNDITTFLYFSFITITTVGYGDILPQTMIARYLAMYLAIIGQLYLTVILSIIIGKYLRFQSNTK